MKWQEPPADGRSARPKQSRSDEINAVAEELKANPGKWALVDEDAWPNTLYVWKKRGLEVRFRMTGEGRKGDIYARYVPEAV